MSPIPGWKVIPDDWAEHHRPTAVSTMTEPAVFRRITDGPAPYPLPDDWTGSQIIWEAKVRVQAQNNAAGSADVAEQPTVTRTYLVTAPLGGPDLRAGERGDVVEVLGRQLRITDTPTGSQLWELDLICVENLTQNNP